MKNKLVLKGVKENISLAKYTTFHIGGKARYFFIAKTKNSLIQSVEAARRSNLPFFILGGGSNLLVSDKGYKGLIIQVKNQKSKIKDNVIFVEAGMALSQLVNLSFKNSLAGLEWAAGIPGTVGGAVYGNAGAFAQSMADTIKTVEILDIKNNKIKMLKNKDCQFYYRKSVFKKNNNFVILSCKLKLKKGNKKEMREKIQQNLDYRLENHPRQSSAGSVFKNLKKIPARKLIDNAGLKGKRIGRAQISKKHANFIVNLNGASSKDVLELIKLVKKTVNRKFSIKLKEEIIYLK